MHSEDSDEEFVDAEEDWIDEGEVSSNNYLDLDGSNQLSRTQTILVPRSFYNILASRAGESALLLGNAAKFAAGPLAIVNNSMAGILSTGGAAAAVSFNFTQ